MMSLSIRTLLLPTFLVLAPAAASAQAGAQTSFAPSAPTMSPVVVAPIAAASPSAVSAAAPVAGPVAEAQAVALKARNTPAPAPAPRASTANNRALMIVGGVGLIAGAVIGGDAGTIVMLGSAGVGLLGLYRFLN